jgi:hypothetical protein
MEDSGGGGSGREVNHKKSSGFWKSRCFAS